MVSQKQLEESNQRLRELVGIQRDSDSAYRALEQDRRQLVQKLEQGAGVAGAATTGTAMVRWSPF